MEDHRSEVAQLIWQIHAEYEAAQRGLSGLAQGAADHRYIAQRTTNMTSPLVRLVTLVGNERAHKMLSEAGL